MYHLTEKQKIFCREYLIDLNASQAAIRAGYSKKAAKEQGARLLAKVSIIDYISHLKEERIHRLEIDADMVVRELWKIALADIGDYIGWDNDKITLRTSDELPKEATSCIEEVMINKTSRSQIVRIKLYDKLSALDKLMRHYGLYDHHANEASGLHNLGARLDAAIKRKRSLEAARAEKIATIDYQFLS